MVRPPAVAHGGHFSPLQLRSSCPKKAYATAQTDTTINDVLSVLRAKTLTMCCRKNINDVLSVRN